MYCTESYSLFPGGQCGPRFGGAGLEFFMLAEELAKDARLRIKYIIANRDAGELSHPTIQIVPQVPAIQRGLPVLSRWINKHRFMESFDDLSNPRVLMSIMGSQSVNLEQISRETGTPTILRLASDADVLNPENPYKDFSSWRIAQALKAMDVILAQNENQRDVLRSWSGLEAEVVGNGWPIPEKIAYDDDRDCILWVASARALKRPWLFADLAKHFPNEQFVMVMPSYESEVLERVEAIWKRTNNLTLINRQLPLEEVYKYFIQAKLFVNTSELEGFPNTFLQAGSASVPIVSLSVNPGEFITKYSTGICADDDFSTLIQGVKDLLYDDENRYRCADASRRYVEEKHDVKMVADVYKRHIFDLVGMNMYG